MKRLLLILAACCIVLPVAFAAEADLTNVQRTRIIMDLVLDGDVATPASYATVDLATAPTAIKYADAIIAYNGVNPNGTWTNEMKATYYLNELKKWHQMFLKHQRETAAGQPAAEAAVAEVIVDLGAEEPIVEVEP